MARYITATEFRNRTNLQSAEYTDAQLEQLIDEATDEIDFKTNRTWQGTVSLTDEYYDGDGKTELWLEKGDVSSIDALSIDEEYDGNYVSVTTSKVLLYEDEGYIVLDTARYSNIEVEQFTKGNKTVKVSFTYGNSTPTEFVKSLCALMVLNDINPSTDLQERIDKRINLLRTNTIRLV